MFMAIIALAALLFILMNIGTLIEIVWWLVCAAFKFGLIASGLALLVWLAWFCH